MAQKVFTKALCSSSTPALQPSAYLYIPLRASSLPPVQQLSPEKAKLLALVPVLACHSQRQYRGLRKLGPFR